MARAKAPAACSAYQRALGLLARREHSRRELAGKLLQGGFAREECDAALEQLGAAHYQDDERFADSLLRSRARQGYGPLRIVAELKNHGLPAVRIAQLLAAVDSDWSALAARQLRRRYPAPTGEPAERRRRWQFLARRGFTAEQARAALAQAEEPADADDGFVAFDD